MITKLLMVAFGLAFAAPSALSAVAGIPLPPCARIPCVIRLVGLTNGVPDPAGRFQVDMKDNACQPVQGVSIVIDFNDCAPDIRLCASQPEVPNVDCSSHEVHGVTDANGTVTFTIVGAANNSTGNAPGYAGRGLCQGAPGTGCAKIYADGVLVGVSLVAAYDQNLSGGVNPADIALWLGDSFAGYHGRSDFDGDDALTPADLSRLLQVALGAGSTTSCGAYCF